MVEPREKKPWLNRAFYHGSTIRSTMVNHGFAIYMVEPYPQNMAQPWLNHGSTVFLGKNFFTIPYFRPSKCRPLQIYARGAYPLCSPFPPPLRLTYINLIIPT